MPGYFILKWNRCGRLARFIARRPHIQMQNMHDLKQNATKTLSPHFNQTSSGSSGRQLISFHLYLLCYHFQWIELINYISYIICAI